MHLVPTATDWLKKKQFIDNFMPSLDSKLRSASVVFRTIFCCILLNVLVLKFQDYHVILLVKLNEGSYVVDFDTILGFVLRLEDYNDQVIRDEENLADNFKRCTSIGNFIVIGTLSSLSEVFGLP